MEPVKIFVFYFKYVIILNKEVISMNYKTNVMRILDKNKINYKSYSYVDTDAISGMEVATILNQNPNQVFKTLVTTSKSKNNYVFVIPVNKELDLKKAAISVNETTPTNRAHRPITNLAQPLIQIKTHLFSFRLTQQEHSK